MPRLTRAQILALVPHAGAMCLLESVIEWDRAGVHCRSETYHRDPAHPLRRNGSLAAVHLLEYGAQAAAVHGGLLARESDGAAGRGGVLAGLRDLLLSGEPVDTIAGPLDIRAYREMGSAQGMIYRFVVESAGKALASGRLTIMAAD